MCKLITLTPVQRIQKTNVFLFTYRFQHHVFGYHGPTLMFITAEGGNMFCLASDEEWRDSKHFWGSDHCICMHLTPEYRVIESKHNIASNGLHV